MQVVMAAHVVDEKGALFHEEVRSTYHRHHQWLLADPVLESLCELLLQACVFSDLCRIRYAAIVKILIFSKNL